MLNRRDAELRRAFLVDLLIIFALPICSPRPSGALTKGEQARPPAVFLVDLLIISALPIYSLKASAPPFRRRGGGPTLAT